MHPSFTNRNTYMGSLNKSAGTPAPRFATHIHAHIDAQVRTHIHTYIYVHDITLRSEYIHTYRDACIHTYIHEWKMNTWIHTRAQFMCCTKTQLQMGRTAKYSRGLHACACLKHVTAGRQSIYSAVRTLCSKTRSTKYRHWTVGLSS